MVPAQIIWGTCQTCILRFSPHQGLSKITLSKSQRHHSGKFFWGPGYDHFLWLGLYFNATVSSSWNLLATWHPVHAAVTQLISLYFASQDWRATSGHGGLNMSGQDGPRSSRSRPSTDGVKRVWKRCAPPPSCLTRTRPTSLYKPATSCRSCSTPKSTHRLMCFRIPIRPKEVARKAIGTMALWRTSEGVVLSIN